MLLAVAGGARAEQAELLVLLDLDHDAASGCASATPERTVFGIELRLRTIVDLDTDQVTFVTHETCVDPVSGTFADETPVAGGSTPPWNVVTGEGTSGSTLIETYLPLSSVPGTTRVEAFFSLGAPVGGDALLDTLGGTGGVPIRITLRPLAVPVLTTLGLALLAVLLLGAIALASRHRLGARGVVTLVLIAGAAIPALVRAGLGDGTLRAWATDERIATDPIDDAPEGADLLAAFAFVDEAQGLLFLRVDALLGPAVCLAWPTVDPGTHYPCIQEPPPDAGPFGYRVALTFDDGPKLETTPSILATLRSEGIPATFFEVGYKMQTAETRALVREIHEDPLFRVGNHSYTHPDFTLIPVEQARSELATTNDSIRVALGDSCYFPRYFRFPFSRSNCVSAGIVRELGLSQVGRHIDTYDLCYASGNGTCDRPNIPVQYQSDMIGWTLYRLQQTTGGVVLMHDVHENTVQMLPALIAALRNAGATFVRLDDASVFPLINAAVNPPEPPACCDGEVR